MKNHFIQIITSRIDLPPEQENRIREVCTIRHLKKGEHFIHAGEIPDKLAFNIKGLFRYYYLDKNGNDFTKGFFQ